MKLSERLMESVQGKEHIIWDWNGTLLADVDHAVQTVNFLLEDHQLPPIDLHTYRNIFEFPVLTYYQKLGFDFEKESFESLCHRFVDRFMKGFKNLPLHTEMKTTLISLHQKGLKQSILSATDQTSLDEMITHFGLKSFFEYIYGIDNKRAGSKIERGRELIRHSQTSLEKVVIVGDTLHDLEVAEALGIDAILISHGHQCSSRLKLHHDKVIEVAV